MAEESLKKSAIFNEVSFIEFGSSPVRFSLLKGGVMRVSTFAFLIGFLGIANLHADGHLEEDAPTSAPKCLHFEEKTEDGKEDLTAFGNETQPETQVEATDTRALHHGEEVDKDSVSTHADLLLGGRSSESGSPGSSLRFLSEQGSPIPIISFPSVSSELPWWERWWQSVFWLGEDA